MLLFQHRRVVSEHSVMKCRLTMHLWSYVDDMICCLSDPAAYRNFTSVPAERPASCSPRVAVN